MRSIAWALVRRAAIRNGGIEIRKSSIAKQYHASVSHLQHSNTQQYSELQRQGEPSFQLDTEKEAHKIFFDFLNDTPSTSRLPQSIGKLDAYLHLRQHDPSSLSRLDDKALQMLCMQGGIERIGGIIAVLLDDFEGVTSSDEGLDDQPDLISQLSQKLQESSLLTKGGIFAAPLGSTRRIKALQNLIIGFSRRRSSKSEEDLPPTEEIDSINNKELSLSDSTLSRALGMLLDDFRILQQEQGSSTDPTSLIPVDMDVGTARRISRSIYRSKNGSLAPVLTALIRHLSRSDMIEGAFPMALEGCQLLNYFLDLESGTPVGTFSGHQASSSTIELPETLQAANHVLDEMNKSIPEVVSDLVIDEARMEGQKYKTYLLEYGIPENTVSELSLHFTLRYIVFLVLMKRKRFNAIQKQLTRIVNDLEATANHFDLKVPLWLLFKPVRLSIYQSVSAEHGRKKSFDIALRFIDIWTLADGAETQTEGGILKVLCEAYVNANDPKLAIQLLQVVLDRRRKGNPTQMAPEAAVLGAQALLRILNNQANDRRGDVVNYLLSRLGLVDAEGRIIDDQIDGLFPEPLRADLIAIVAKAGLKRQSRSLYERWGAPLKEAITIDKINAHIKEVTNRRIPKRKQASHIQRLAYSEEASAPISQSHKCLTALIKAFTKDHPKPLLSAIATGEGGKAQTTSKSKEFVSSIQEDIQFAYHVLFQFVQSRDRTLMERPDFLALSSVYFCLGQRMAAFKCLGDIQKREEKPTLEEAALFIKLLATVDLTRTVGLFLDRIAFWADGNLSPGWAKGDERLSSLYTPLLGRCLRSGQVGLAEKLLASAKANGIQEELGVRAVTGLIKFTLKSIPQEEIHELVDAEAAEGINPRDAKKGSDTLYIAKWVKNLMERDKYRPEPSLLSWMIQKAVREPGLVSTNRGTGKKGFVPFSLKDNNRKAAILTLSLSARKLGYIDAGDVKVILSCIQNKAYHLTHGKVDSRITDAGLVNEVDQITSIIRWAPYIHYNDGFMLIDQIQSNVVPPTGEASKHPNKLPAALYCRLIVTYLRIGDIFGAASVMSWARDEAGLTFEEIEAHWETRRTTFRDFLRSVAFATKKRGGPGSKPSEVLELLSGASPVPKSKMWWERPTNER